MTGIERRYIEARPRARALYERAVQVIPNGVTHDGRFVPPFLPYIQSAHGSRKEDIDGHTYVDWVMGHGALLLGHGRKEVVAAIADQVGRGTHYGANHELEVRWAELVKELVPSVERIRFTGSGTEATHLAVRLARAFTGRPTIVRFQGHFHGWHDYVAGGDRVPWDGRPLGVPEAVWGTVEVLPHDLEALAASLAGGDVAAVILEPGASWGSVPLPEGFLHGVRELTARRGVVLIFDEVITGFRWSPGGAQAVHGIPPDLTTFAKILTGGVPGGAVGGRAEIMAGLEFAPDPAREKVVHQGTFNANPLAAASGIACLTLAKDGSVQRAAAETAAQLRAGMNAMLARLKVRGCVYGESSIFHVLLGHGERHEGDLRDPHLPIEVLRRGTPRPLGGQCELALMNHGVQTYRLGGFVSDAHTSEDVELTLRAFEAALRDLRAEGLL